MLFFLYVEFLKNFMVCCESITEKCVRESTDTSRKSLLRISFITSALFEKGTAKRYVFEQVVFGNITFKKLA